MARAAAVTKLRELQDRNAPAPACVCEDFCTVSQKWGYGEEYDLCLDKCKNPGDWNYDTPNFFG